MRISAIILVLAPVTAILCGCPPAEKPLIVGPDLGDQARNTSTTTVSARWPFWPVRMRIHPLTAQTIDRRSGDLFIDARIEFFDQFGHTVKGIAQFRFELHDHDPGEGPARAIKEWNVDLRDMDANAVHYDTVTKTYLCRLGLEEPLDPGRRFLRVYVFSIDGRTFQRTIELW